MSSVEYVREFVNERLTVSTEGELFGVFDKTIVKYEEEIDHQRRLLDIVRTPEIKLHRIELPQQHVCKEEEEEDLADQERNSSLDQKDPEPPQMKEEQEELCASLEGEQLVLKQETETFILTPTYEESDHQLLSDNSHTAESQDEKKGDSESTTMSDILCNGHTSKNSFQCDTCGKAFEYKSKLKIHLRSHTGERPYSCDTCGKTFSQTSQLSTHMRIHTGEKPYSCSTCGKTFSQASVLNTHIRIHTGEKPYSCQTCEKCFKFKSGLFVHMRTHTGERPYLCKTCGKRYCDVSVLKKHMTMHTGEKPYSCKTCGKDFRLSGHLTIHMKRAHTGSDVSTY